MKTRPHGDVIAAITHDVLNTERFSTEGDLAEAVKCRCARLRVAYDSGRVAAAITLVARTRPTVAAAVTTQRAVASPLQDVRASFTVTRQQAAEIMATIRARLRAPR